MPLGKFVESTPRGVGGIILDAPADPVHLSPLSDALDRAIYTKEKVRFCFSAPPQHGKTGLIQFALGQAFARDPRFRFGYGSYADRQAIDRSKAIRDVAEYLGVDLRKDVQAGPFWRTTSGGFMYAGGIGGQWTGKTFDVMVLDDPYSERRDAESALYRQAVEALLRNVQDRTRAIIVTHTRWHPEDIIGQKSRDKDWTYVNLPAICEVDGDPDSHEVKTTSRIVGQPLWPERKPLEFFSEAQKDAHDWASLYQGRPRPRGSQVFQREPSFYDELPNHPRVAALGYDLAASSRKTADFQGGALMLVMGEDFYIVSFEQRQCTAPEFVDIINRVSAGYETAKRFGFIGGTELGVVQMHNESRPGRQGARLVYEIARLDKFARAQPFAVAWNAGRVHLPRHAPWLRTMVDQLQSFTGVGDKHDDIVDMLAACHYILKGYARPVGQRLPGPVAIKSSGFGRIA
jgi:predicted phage terminase large subunit-like protein